VREKQHMPKEYLDRIAIAKKFGYDIEKERQLIIDMSGPLKGRILEVGTGKGYLAIALARKGHYVTSIDISEEGIAKAKSVIKGMGLEDSIKLKVENALSMSFADQSFDSILLVNVLHHLNSPFVVFDEIIRVLAPAGKIIISDFSKKGFDVLDEIFAVECREHSVGEFDLEDMKKYFLSKELKTEEHNSEFQNMIIVKV